MRRRRLCPHDNVTSCGQSLLMRTGKHAEAPFYRIAGYGVSDILGNCKSHAHPCRVTA